MIVNRINIVFLECDPAPSRGYNVQWRVAGSGDPFTDAGNFFVSPAVIIDNVNPPGTQYEGTVTSKGVNTNCNPQSWSTEQQSVSGSSGGGGGSYAIALTSPCIGGNPNSTFQISGFNPGDLVKVRAVFSGMLFQMGGLFTRADVGISSPDGTIGLASSTCYTDGLSHGFSIIAVTNITMVGTSAVVNTSAVIHNGSESPTNLVVEIIEVNGVPVSVYQSGCKGNSATGGTC